MPRVARNVAPLLNRLPVRSELQVLLRRNKPTCRGTRDGSPAGELGYAASFEPAGHWRACEFFSCHLQPAPRAQLESALALKYGLTPKFIEAAAERSPGHWATYDL